MINSILGIAYRALGTAHRALGIIAHRALRRPITGIVFAGMLFAGILPTPSPAQEFTATTLGDYGNVTVMEVAGSYDARNTDGTENEAARQAVAVEFFRTHKDEYDFLFVFTTFDHQMLEEDAAAFYHSVRNDTGGLGMPLFRDQDPFPLYGSDNKLQGMIDMGNLSSHVTDPLDPEFEVTLGTLSHELMHRWAAKVKLKDAAGNPAGALLGKDGFHWSFLFDAGGSLMYGNRWRDNGNGTFTSLAPRSGMNTYGPLDLYLMGMIGADEVPPMLLIENASGDPARLPEANVTVSGTARLVTINDIIDANGPRVPGAAQAQKTFKTAFLLLTRPGAFTGQEVYDIENVRNGWITRHSILTDGKSLVEVVPAAREDLPSNPGPLPPNNEARTADPSISDGIAWLVANQQQDGSWMDIAQTRERDTTETLLTLQDFPGAQQERWNGLAWLNTMASGNIDFLSRKVLALAGAGQDASVPAQELLSRRNGDGGWGGDSFYASSNADTALALQALAAAGVTDQAVLSTAIGLLASRQNSDGGWGGGDRGSLVQETSRVLSVLHANRGSFDLEGAIANGRDWLVSRQNAATDGGFGNSPSTVYDTAIATMALRELNVPTSVTNPAIEFLRSRQTKNGSWDQSAYETALATRALQRGTVDPDLMVTAESISFIPAAVTSLPADIVINVTVANLGGTEVPQARVALHDGPVSDATKIGEQVVAVVGRGEANVTFAASVADGSVHRYTVSVDPLNEVAESNETNNSAVRELQVQETYDFEIRAGDVTIEPAAVDLLEDTAITFTVRNRGTRTAYSLPVQVFLSTADGQKTIAATNVDLPANGSVTKTLAWRADSAGTGMTVTVQADPQQDFAELSETNNSASATVTVNARTLPNLSVSFKDLTVSPDPAMEGGTAAITAVVRNDGASAAQLVDVKFFSTVSGTTVQLPPGAPLTQTLPSLDPGQSATVTLTWDNLPEAGEKIVTVTAAMSGQAAEIRQDDNEAFIAFTVLGLPDLALSANSIVLQPAFPHDGDAATITVSVLNGGDQEARNVVLRLQEDGATIGESTIASIAGHSAASATFDYGTAGKSGAHEITVLADPDGLVNERDRSNNSARRSFGVQDANLWVSEPYFSPNGDGVKDAAALFFRLASPRTVTVEVVDGEGATVRTLDSAGPAQVTEGSVSWDGLNDGGTVVDDGEYRFQVKDPSGTAIAGATVTVDLDRLPLPLAFGTDYLLHSSLTCQLPELEDWRWLGDDSAVVARLPQSPAYPEGIYTVSPDGADVVRLVPWEWTGEGDGTFTYSFGLFDLSPDGERVAFAVHKTNVRRDTQTAEIWTVRQDGTGLGLVDEIAVGTSNNIYSLLWSPRGDRLLYRVNSFAYGTGSTNELRVAAPGVAGSTAVLATGYIDPEYLSWSPDGANVAYLRRTGSIRQAMVVGLDGSSRQVFGDMDDNNGTSIDQLRWLDPQRLIVGIYSMNPYGLWIVDADGVAAPVQVATESSDRHYLSIAPGGGHFAFRRAWSDAKLYLSDAAGNVSAHTVRTGGYNCRPYFSDVVWSPDGGSLAFSEGLGDGGEGMGTCTDTAGPQVIVLNAGTMEERSYQAGMAPAFWLQRGGYLVGSESGQESDAIASLRLATGATASAPLPKGTRVAAPILFLSPREKHLAYSQWIYETDPCWRSGQVSTQTYMESELLDLTSVMNLTADLRIMRRKTGIILRGIATDLHFEGYRLDYASVQTPENWLPVLPPSDREALDEVFTTWVPPAKGAYFVRLTVWDKAGNVALSRKRVSWSESPSITNVRQSTPIFSPNNDTILDSVELAYQVLAPVNLEFRIRDGNGELVRTIVQPEPSAGDSVMSWDGRDDGQNYVPDGKYTIGLLDVEFPVEVDTTAPTVYVDDRLEAIEDPYTETVKTYVNVRYRATDKNMKQWSLDTGDGADPQDWKAVLADTGNTGDGVRERRFGFDSQDMPLTRQFVGKRTRITAEDAAGNRNAMTGPLLPEKLIADTWDGTYVGFAFSTAESGTVPIPADLAGPGPHTITGEETIAPLLVSMNVQYTEVLDIAANAGNAWANGAVVSNPDDLWYAPWDSSVIGPFRAYAVRMRGRDEWGRTLYSDTLFHERFVLEESCSDRVPIVGEVSLLEPLASLELALRVKPGNAKTPWSAEDRYRTYDIARGDVVPRGYFEPPVPAGAIQPEQTYELRMTGTGMSGRAYEYVLTFPVQPCLLAVPVRVRYHEAPACESVSEGFDVVSANIDEEDPLEVLKRKQDSSYHKLLADLAGSTLIDLTYFLAGDGEARQVGRIADPAEISRIFLENHGSAFSLPVTDLAEGHYSLSARLVYVDNATRVRKSSWTIADVFVDRALPEAALTVPAPGSAVCPVQVQRKSGPKPYVEITGLSRENRNVPRGEQHSASGLYKLKSKEGPVPGDIDRGWTEAKGLMTAISNIKNDENGELFGAQKDQEQILGYLAVNGQGEDRSIKLEAISETGNKSCAVTGFRSLPATVRVTASADRQLVSATGTPNVVTLTYSVSEPSVVDVTVHRTAKDALGQTILTDPPVATLVSGADFAGGTATVDWNVWKDFTEPFLDGDYGIQVAAAGPCGSAVKTHAPVEVDNTPPTAGIASPAAEAVVGGVVKITGTARDDHFETYRLEAEPPDGSGLHRISTGSLSVGENGALGSWNTYGLANGSWTLLLTASDRVGNEATAAATVTVGNSRELIGAFDLAPAVISPNGDGRAESALISYETVTAANVEIAILDQGGLVRKTYPMAVPSAGRYELVYEGKDAAGAVLDDGGYRARLTASLPANPATVQTENIEFVIDKADPTIGLSSPGDGAYLAVHELAVTGTIADDNLAEYSLRITGPSGEEFADAGNESRNGYVFGRLSEPAEGTYTLHASARDLGENDASKTAVFTIDRTPPAVRLDAPAEGGWFGTASPAVEGGRETVSIAGEVVEKNLDVFRLRYGSGDNPAEWTDLLTGTEVPQSSALHEWAVGAGSGVADGRYTLSLLALDKAGQSGEKRVSVTVDNTPPTAAITDPQPGSYLRAGDDIRGTADDATLDSYRVETSRGACESAYEWTAITASSSTVRDGVLARWQAVPAEGEYCLRLTVTDKVGSVSTASVAVTVDSTPPAPPALTGSRENTYDARLSWSGNGEPDLAGYYLYRGGEKLNDAPMTEQEFLDAALAEGAYLFTVRAVDRAGNESGPSNTVTVRIDLSGPAARIAKPAAGAVISGFIAVTGAAYSADDFKQYRVLLGEGTAPSSWMTVRTSPLAVPNGLLAELDTSGLADGGIYTIRLEAEDLAGNVTIDEAAVTIDNTPPQAPVLSPPEVDGSTVTLQWSEVADGDLAGYLLWVNDRLVNAPSSLTSEDLTPYVLACASYYHYDLPDGEFTYTVAAIDRAGNMSFSPQPVVATIDTRAPVLAVTEPTPDSNGNRTIGGGTDIVVETPDLDVDVVTFYAAPAGSAEWVSFGEARAVPYRASFQPQAYGQYDIRAEALDRHSPVPNHGVSPVVTITYADLTPPAAPSGLAAQVDGNRVSLAWNGAADGDRAGYLVYRTSEGWRQLLTSTPLAGTATGYEDLPWWDDTFQYEVTAVDGAGNESAPAAVAARVYAPQLAWPVYRTAQELLPVQGSGATPGAAVTISVLSSAGSGTPATATADGAGAFQAEVLLAPGDNAITAVATDAAGNVSRPSNQVSSFYDAPPAAPSGLAASVLGADVTLSWTASPDGDVTGYHIYRDEGAGWSRITVNAVAGPTWTDGGLGNGTYRYRATATDGTSESAPTDAVEALVSINGPGAPAGLAASALPDGEAEITWTDAAGNAAGYLLYRGTTTGGPYDRITGALLADASYHDGGLADGRTYYYVATALDAYGNESGYSNEGLLVAIDATAPSQPVIDTPTTADAPLAVTSPTATVGGSADPFTTVELLRNGSSVGTTAVQGSAGGSSAWTINESVYNASMSPDGTMLAYEGDQAVSILDLSTGGTSELTAAGFAPAWSPDGTRVVYKSTASYPATIEVYDLSSGTSVPLPDVLPSNFDGPFLWTPAGNAFLFYGQGNGPVVYGEALWMKDLVSGGLSPVVDKDGIGDYALSPDGARLAYRQGSSLFALDLATGQETVVMPSTNGWSFSWSPDGGRIAFMASTASGNGLFVVDAATGSTVLLAETAGYLYLTAWYPDGQRIAYGEWDGDTWLASVKTVAADGSAPPLLIEEGMEDVWFLDVDGSGALSYAETRYSTSQSLLKTLSTGGRFAFSEVALDAGENVFTAVARDASGNASVPSRPVTITYSAPDTPDLEITDSDLFVYPAYAVAGETVAASVTVRNRGAAIARDVEVAVYVLNAHEQLEVLATERVGDLDAGASALVTASWNSGGMTGENLLIAVADPENRIGERNETNNLGTRDIVVVERAGMTMTTALDGAEYGANAAMDISVTVRNSGRDGSGTLAVRIEDGQGALAAVFDPVAVALSYGESAVRTFPWNTGGTFAGSYRVRAVLDGGSGTLAENDVPFVILPDGGVEASIFTDKAGYGANEAVQIGSSVNNRSVNRFLQSLVTRISVTNAAGEVLLSDEESRTAVLPGTTLSRVVTWHTGTSPAGDYTATVETTADGETVARADARFIVRGTAKITGEVTVDPDPVPFGSAFQVNYTLRNSGNAGSGAATARLLVLDRATQAVLERHDEQLVLASGATATGSASFPASSGTLAPLTAVLQYVEGSGTRVLASAPVTVKDVTAPALSVLSPVEGQTATSTVVFSVAVSDDASGVDSVEYRRDGGTWSLLPVADAARGRFGTTWEPTMADNGIHSAGFRAVDRSGNRSGETTVSYEVRINRAPTAPSVAWPADGSDVETALPALAVNNASDPNGDALTYSFEVFADGDMKVRIDSAAGIPEGAGTTSWTVQAALTENAVYYWRAKAHDGGLFGPWSGLASFRVNVMNDPPDAPTVSSPSNGSEVPSTAPVLTVNNAFDPDSTELTYNFKVAVDPECLVTAASVTGVPSGGETTSWQADPPLNDNTTYYWCAQADDWLDAGPWSAGSRFFVNTANDPPSVPVILSPADGSEVVVPDPDIVLQNSIDPESQTVTYDIEVDNVGTFDSPALISATGISEGQGTTVWNPGVLNENTAYYVRARAGDGNAGSDWTQPPVEFFVNTANERPGTPVPFNPPDGGGVDVVTPTLSVQNAVDPDRDALTYEFSLFGDAEMTVFVDGASGLAGQPEVTSWTVTATLLENHTYYWRARAHDGELAGDWTAPQQFTVNTGNDEPGVPVLVSPAEGGSVDTLTPALTVLNTTDPDGDRLTYEFEVYAGGSIVWSVVGVAEGTDGSTSAVVDVALVDNRQYEWRARAFDGDRSGTWSAMGHFTVHIAQTSIKADIEIEPETLNRTSRGNWVMAEIELPHGYRESDIDVSSIRLEGTVPAVAWPHHRKKHRREHGCDDDRGEHEHGEIKVKFRRDEVIAVLPAGDHVPVHITGTVSGVPFEGVDIIRVIH